MQEKLDLTTGLLQLLRSLFYYDYDDSSGGYLEEDVTLEPGEIKRQCGIEMSDRWLEPAEFDPSGQHE